MRQVGLLPHERDARRFLAFLITQDIEATCERGDDAWVVWIHDEDQLNQARHLLKEYQAHPDDPRYQDAQRLATQKIQEKHNRSEQAQKNVVEVGGNWRGGAGPGRQLVGRKAPLTVVIIVMALLVAAFTQLGDSQDSGTYRALTFVEIDQPDWEKIPPFRDVLRGQVWRLVTPCFLHFGAAHLIFNCLALFMLGSQVEERRGPYFLIAFMLVSAVVSNSLQALVSPAFGGLSGVLYAVFGYMWMVVLNGNRERYDLSPGTIGFCLGWLVLCILRDIPATARFAELLIPEHIANVAHVVGMFIGMVFGAVASRK